MHDFLTWVNNLDWILIIVVCLTWGLAPFAPPHIYEKLQMLVSGKLVKPMDWFDLLAHGAPWLLLIIKAGVTLKK